MTKKDLSQFPLWTAVVTPMNLDTTIDFDSLEKILKEQASAKNAIVILGSTGEALNLKKSEWKRVLDFTLNLKLNVPVMTGVGGFNLDETLDYIDYLNTLSLDAYLLVTPLYAKPGENGQKEWFKALLNRAQKPCMLYNVPGRTGVKLHPGAVKSLNSHPNFWALKEASGSVSDFKKFQESVAGQKIYSGDDSMLCDFIPHGCVGLVSVASNAWPSEIHQYVKSSLKQELNQSEINMFKKACDSLFIASNPIPVKGLMCLQGKIKTSSLRLPLHHNDLSQKSFLIEQDTIVKKWSQEKK